MSYYGDPIADVEYFKMKMLNNLRVPKKYLNSHDNRTHKLMMIQLSKEIKECEEQLAYPSAMRDAGIFLTE